MGSHGTMLGSYTLNSLFLGCWPNSNPNPNNNPTLILTLTVTL